MNERLHIPVLLDSTVEFLSPHAGDRYLDLTAGYGGHAGEMLQRLGSGGEATLVDRDRNAIEYLERRFAGDGRVTILQSDFLSASKQLANSGEHYDCILADLGLSSPHLDNPVRGFSFMSEGPLDMRMDQSSTRTAADIVNSASAEELADLLYRYGELRGSRKLADRIIEHRPYSQTDELAAVIPGPHKNRMRTLAQVFQALRIAVNDELVQLEESLPLWHQMLKPQGRLAVITFHSLEDRLVKRYFQEHGANVFGSELSILTRKPITAGKDEIAINPRARSAKLRVVQRK